MESSIDFLQEGEVVQALLEESETVLNTERAVGAASQRWWLSFKDGTRLEKDSKIPVQQKRAFFKILLQTFFSFRAINNSCKVSNFFPYKTNL